MADKQRIIALRSLLADRLIPAIGGEVDVIVPDPTVDRLAWFDRHGAGVRLVTGIGMDVLDKPAIDRLPDLVRVQVLGAGMDGYDLAELARRGIDVENSGAIHASETADFAMTLMLAARRNLLAAERWLREDRWASGGMMAGSRSLTGAKVGIAGLGFIGEAIARRVEPFCPAVRWWGPRAKPAVPWPRCDSLLELAEWADILFIAVRAHDDSRGLVTREIIDALGPDGLLVNISRGFVVDEDALIAALKDGRLGQAALDVFDPEPTPAARWADVPNVLVTPHVAGSTDVSAARLPAHLVERVRAFFGV